MQLLQPLLRRVMLVVVLAVAVAVLDGCTNGVDEPAPSDAGAGSEAAAPPLRVVTRVTRVVGELPDDRRQALRLRAQAIVERYLRAAFLAEESGKASFPEFTQGARAVALRHADVLTRSGLRDVEDVVPRAATASVAVLAAHRRVAGATVRLAVRLRATVDGTTRALRIGGRLLLTPSGHGLEVFGFDLHRSAATAPGGES